MTNAVVGIPEHITHLQWLWSFHLAETPHGELFDLNVEITLPNSERVP